MKKILSVGLMVLLVFSLAVPAFAADSTEITVERIDLENGDHIIVTTYVENSMMRANQKSATRVYDYYKDHSVAWAYTLRGTFVYDGSKARAIASSGSYVINDSRWTCTDSDYYSGDTVYGTVTGKGPLVNQTAHLTITCSPNGTISGTVS